MASNRHLGRIIALQTLFEQDFRRVAGDTTFDIEAVLQRNIDRYKATVDDKDGGVVVMEMILPVNSLAMEYSTLYYKMTIGHNNYKIPHYFWCNIIYDNTLLNSYFKRFCTNNNNKRRVWFEMMKIKRVMT